MAPDSMGGAEGAEGDESDHSGSTSAGTADVCVERAAAADVPVERAAASSTCSSDSKQGEELTNLGEMSNELLRKHLERRGLSTRGKHAVLKTRLQKALVAAAGAQRHPSSQVDEDALATSPRHKTNTMSGHLSENVHASTGTPQVIDLSADDDNADPGRLLCAVSAEAAANCSSNQLLTDDADSTSTRISAHFRLAKRATEIKPAERTKRLRIEQNLGTTDSLRQRPGVRATIGSSSAHRLLSRFQRWNQSGVGPQTLQKYSKHILRVIDQDLMPQLPQGTDLSDPVVEQAIVTLSISESSRKEIRAAVKKFVAFLVAEGSMTAHSDPAATDQPPGSARRCISVPRRLRAVENKKARSHRHSGELSRKISPQRYIVEAIEGCRPAQGSSNGFEYLVKWRGFARSENTWEPEDHLTGNIALSDYKDSLQGTGLYVATNRSASWPSDLNDFQNYVLSKGLSAATCKLYRSALSRCYARLDQLDRSRLAKRDPVANDALLEVAKQERGNCATPAVNMWIRFLASPSASRNLAKPAYVKRWRDLTREEHAAATVLGLDQATWDSEHVPPSCCDPELGCVLSWLELDIRLLRAAEALGYTEQIWTFQMGPHLRKSAEPTAQSSEDQMNRQMSTCRAGDRALSLCTEKIFEEVEWDQILPLRFYVAHSKRASAAATAAGQCDDASRSRAIVMQCSTLLRNRIDEQALMKLSEQPKTTVQKHIIVGRIVDKTHPCVTSSAGRHVYGAFARECIPPFTVLGYYGGLTQTTKSVDAIAANDLNAYAFGLRCSEQWQGGDGWLEIDGERGTNELAMVNDFRVDVSERALNGDVAQPRTPNAEPIEVWMPTDKLPSVVFVSTREICKHAEITIDYGADYWRGFQRRQRSSQEGENVIERSY